MALVHVSVGASSRGARVVVWGEGLKAEAVWEDTRVEMVDPDNLHMGMQTLMEMRAAGMVSKEQLLRRLSLDS